MCESENNEFDSLIGEDSSDVVLPDDPAELPNFVITPSEEAFKPLPAAPDEKFDPSTDYFGNLDADLFDETTIRISDYSAVPDLRFVTFGLKVTSYEKGFFEHFMNLERIDVCEGNKRFSSKLGVLFDRSKKMLLRYPPMKSDDVYFIPEGVEVIDRHAFYGVKRLRGLVFPKTLKMASFRSFVDCPYIGVPLFASGVELMLDSEMDKIRESFGVSPRTSTTQDKN